jgi:RimJ/RimL family protein N-acetyltransferase
MALSILPQTFYSHNIPTNADSSAAIALTSSSLPLILRTFLPKDILVLAELLSNPANTQDDLSVSTKTPEEMNDMVKEWLIVSEPLTRLNFLVLDSGAPVGVSGIGWIGWQNKDDESAGRAGAVGVMLNPEVRRKGFGYEAMRISVDYGLRELGLAEVRVGTTSKNVAMRQLMENKFGIPAQVTEPDRFGNDLVWKIRRDEWLGKKHV